MEEVKANNQEKLSYEQLENVCHQLSEQARTLYQKLQEATMTNAFRRLDYLFEVLRQNTLFPNSFVEACINEVMATMTLPKEDQEDSTEE